ncbi:MAG TPA: thiamine phosphate synthase [Bryobacteraceae bacterium]|nr:thiamine phosphate synthase [Bryobacteraceae bacterium]
MIALPAFYPILDTGAAARHSIAPFDAAVQLIESGVRILQVRHKGFLSREILETLERLSKMCRGAGVLFVVNDRADIARLTGAALHLGQDDLPPSEARKITGPDAIIGFSTHNESQLRAAAPEPVDYLAIGPIFGTSTKENPDPTVGLDEFRRLRPLADRPLVAIGGITRVNAKAVLDAGADSVAVIGDLFPDDGNLRRRAADWLTVTGSASR